LSLAWQEATVAEIVRETPNVRTLMLHLERWSGHRPGQHVDIRLTAEDGYQAERAYSIASAPEDAHVAITVERLEDGEVSPYLVDEVEVGDSFEVRGPIGGYFVWEAGQGGPLLLVAGGSGVVPFRSMLRHRVAAGSDAPARLVYSSRTLADVIFSEELDSLAGRRDGFELVQTLTREAPPSWSGRTGRVDDALLREVAWPPDAGQTAFVCGPTRFVESVAGTLLLRGHDPHRIKTERFGGS
jgi:ferredoxin-NADP reductase